MPSAFLTVLVLMVAKMPRYGAGVHMLERMHAGEDYLRTLIAWTDRFRSQYAAIRAQGFDDRFERFWLFYLAYCAAGFSTARTDVLRVALQRI